MSVNPLLLPVRKDTETVRQTVLTNVIKMFYHRKWISKENLENQIKQAIDTHNDDHIYKITLDVSLSTFPTYNPDEIIKDTEINDQDNYVIIKLLPQKVMSISKSPIISEFLNSYKKSHKILVVENISDKAKHQLISNKKTEVFNEVFFMINLLEHVCSPEYEVLTPDESKELLDTYHLSRRQMKLMLDSDPASLYLFLKKKQIVRIIRNSELTGKSVDYRIIVHKGN